MSTTSASEIVSASTAVTPSIQLLTTSLARVPAPASPTCNVREPIALKIGCARASASSEPDASTTSVPCSAGAFVPRTGESTSIAPCSSASSRHRSTPWTPIVLVCTQTAPDASAGSARAALSSTALASLSIVIRRSQPVAASRGSPNSSTPCSRSGSARSAVRFHTRTAKPARARLRAIGSPMVPVPRSAICVTSAQVPRPASAPNTPQVRGS